MATVTSLAAMSSSDTDTTSYSGNAGTPTTGDALICFVWAVGTLSAGSMTGTWTWEKLTSFSVGGTSTIYVFMAYATAGTSTTPTFSCTDDAATACFIQCFNISGTGGGGSVYVRQFKSATGSGTNPAVTMDAAILTGNPVLGCAANFLNNSAQFTAPTSWTEGGEASTATTTATLETAYRNSGETGTTITWTNANALPWGAVVVELYNTGTGPTTVTPMMAYGDGYFGEVYLR